MKPIIALSLLTVGLQAQGLGGLLKKPEVPKVNNSAAPSLSPDQALGKGAELITYVTLATDQGMGALNSMISMFPPAKVAGLAKLSAQYNELKGKRKDGNIDAEQLKVASAAQAETAKLEGDWKSYQKDKSKAVSKAHAQLGLMTLADGAALKVAPDTLKGLQANLDSLQTNPMQAGTAAKLGAQVAILTAVTQQVPAQIQSASTVRSISKKIADAEKIKLAADLDPAKVKDSQALATTIKEIEG